MKRKVYVASSWRNEHYPEVVRRLREAGHKVYDFRNPPSGDEGFKWSSISEDYMVWSPQKYREQLEHPKAVRQFRNDIEAMEACDTCVLVLPCGRSAHTEAGWFAGRGKKTVVYIPERQEPELMKRIFADDKELVYYLHTGKLPELDMFGEIPPIPKKPKNLKDKGQRKICGCMISKDIGMYNTCLHFCVYCYANTSKEAVLKNKDKHNDESESIIG